LPFAFGQLGTYRLTRRLGALPVLATGAVVYGLAFVPLADLPTAALAGWMVLLGLLAAVIFPPTLALVAEWSAATARASAMAAFNLAGSLGFALGPLAGAGLAAVGGERLAFRSAGIAAIVAGLIVALLARRLGHAATAPDVYR